MQSSDNLPGAIVLLSGGIDSTVTLAIAKDKGFLPYALTFFYNQRHYLEIESARKIASFFGIKHTLIDISKSLIWDSALIKDSLLTLPKDRSEAEISSSIPPSYVPARNIIFLSYAVGFGESLGIRDIFIGVNSIDYSGYPDCRAEFIKSFQEAVNLGLKSPGEGSPFKIHTPVIDMKKSQIIQKGLELGVDFSLTHSCYDPQEGFSCGRCDACILRLRAFREVGINDPIPYRGF